jgi:hypothetical protein
MTHRRSIRGRVAIIAILTACTTEERPPQAAQTATQPNVVSLTATEYAFGAPDSIAPGWTKFTLSNRGQEIHYGHIVRLDSGKTVQQLVAAYAEAIRTSGPRPKWVGRFGGPGGAAPGDSSSVTQYIEPGTYVWICPIEDSTGAPHFGKGEFKQFVVHSAGTVAADRPPPPEAGIVVRLMDYSFAVDSAVPAGQYTVRVENAGVQPHDLVVMKLAPGTTLEDLRAAMNPERARRPEQKNEPPPSIESLGTLAGGIAVIGPKLESFFEANLTSGDYALLCMTTAPDGRSHIEHGMIRQIRVN